MQNILQRLERLEKHSGITADRLTVILKNGEKRSMLWSDALMLILSDEVSDLEGYGELAGLCKIMMKG